MILPLFCLLGKSLGNKEEFANKVRTGLAVTCGIYLAVSAVLTVCARPIVVFMRQDSALVEQTASYVRLETVAALFSTAWRFMFLVLVTLKKDRYIYIILGIQTALSVLLDTFLVSELPISARLGVNGIAVTNIIVNISVLAVAATLMRREGIYLFAKTRLDFSWLKEWFAIGKFSGLESLLRNCAFMIMIVRMTNIVSEQGVYWVANNFIWNWLLLPELALADLVKKEVGESKENIRIKTPGYVALTVVFSAAWIASIPLWKPFLRHVMNVADYEAVYSITLIETGFYITFLFNNGICDSTFYGLGRTDYMLIQSLCIDVFYYGVMFILYLTGVFVPTLLGIALMFGIGMTLDFIPTLLLYIRMLKKDIKRSDV